MGSPRARVADLIRVVHQHHGGYRAYAVVSRQLQRGRWRGELNFSRCPTKTKLPSLPAPGPVLAESSRRVSGPTA